MFFHLEGGGEGGGKEGGGGKGGLGEKENKKGREKGGGEGKTWGHKSRVGTKIRAEIFLVEEPVGCEFQ